MLIGGQAVLLHGRPRFTEDVDVTLAAGPAALPLDLLIHKLLAGRPRDIEDAEGVVKRRGAQLDWTYLERWAEEFALVAGREGMPTALARLKAIRLA